MASSGADDEESTAVRVAVPPALTMPRYGRDRGLPVAITFFVSFHSLWQTRSLAGSSPRVIKRFTT
jgi:hypothetical protein